LATGDHGCHSTAPPQSQQISQGAQAGLGSQKGPEDAFWGAWYAIVEDPDGNAAGS